jgi:hypothetical protein
MSRSEYIYVVERPGELPAAFTVKHELVTWLLNHQPLPPGLKIWRCDDGAHKRRPPREIPLSEIAKESSSLMSPD